MNLSLNDAATLLIQLEPDNHSELVHLKEMLSNITQSPLHPESFRTKIVQAVQKIDEIMESSVSDPDSALMEVGDLIESAMHIMEDSEITDSFQEDSPDQDRHSVDDKIEKDVSTPMYEEKKASDEKIPMLSSAYQDETEEMTDTEEKPEPEKDTVLSSAYQDETEEMTDTEEKPEPEKDTVMILDEAHASAVDDYMPENADIELMNAFITESDDLLTKAEEALLLLENDPNDMDAVSTVFRAFHTVKGTSGFLGLSLIAEAAHHAESLLSRVRDREIKYTGEYPDLSLRSVDMLKELLQSVQDALDGKPFLKPEGYDELILLLSDPERAGISDELNDISLSEPQISEIPKTQEITIETKTSEDKASPDKSLRETETSEAETIRPAADNSQKTQPDRKKRSRRLVESSIRVPIDRLDRFIDTVGELVVAHSMVAQDEVIGSGKHHELMKKVTHTGKIVRELQSMSMSMRMIPLRSTFQRMARLVRDLSRKAGKQVTFVAEGEDTEIDRNMVDYINDPLVHMVRNAVDHGIELPDDREKADKSRNGIVKISAYHSAGNVVVEIRDDGKGLDRKAILEKALENKLITEEELKEKQPGDREVFNLIFQPGFSTAKIISDVSGRGVGMDVVKTNIESLRGQIDIQSRQGKGTVFKISLPLTLAIIDGMVLRVGTEKYVMPTISIVRSVRPKAEDISTVLRHGEMLLIQGRLIPLVRLAHLFNVKDAESDPTLAIVMVVEDEGRQAGLIIDELIGTQQIVIKTLGEMMRNIPGISGSAIMPDGRVGLILDVGGLVRLANKDLSN